jgi:hypothetical protein
MEVSDMSVSGWIMMTIMLVGVWGGFLYLLAQTMKQKD